MSLWVCGVGQDEKWRMKTGDGASMGGQQCSIHHEWGLMHI